MSRPLFIFGQVLYKENQTILSFKNSGFVPIQTHSYLQLHVSWLLHGAKDKAKNCFSIL